MSGEVVAGGTFDVPEVNDHFDQVHPVPQPQKPASVTNPDKEEGGLFLVREHFYITQAFLKDKAEALPLIHPEKEFFAIHVLNTVDAIDYNHAVIRQLSSGLRVGFEKYAFIEEKVEGEHIFRIFLDDRIRSVYSYLMNLKRLSNLMVW
ncbi:imm11 family protein [Thermoactinomyces mirandus]|uniref:Immunity MXAN-0049 protein domain-containing protein n=1 Tax=Thermoactinomyces mirandus TaxID=2756294 RepID=A0A7W1XS01_9BACL|nr:DUF1629 domain-containing protein [Thermoactinomyces mirandus]MBA4602066.1 hypothetical protein [Thermoactinomyces mirandus]